MWLLMRMWIGYTSTIMLWILTLLAYWRIWSILIAAQRWISCCEDGMHWPDGSRKIRSVGGHCCGTFETGQMDNHLKLFEMVWDSFWCCVYFIIALVVFMHDGLCWEFRTSGLTIEMHVFRKCIVARIAICTLLLWNWLFGMFAPQQSAWMISQRQKLCSSLWSWLSSKETNNQPCSILVNCQ